MKSKEEMIKIIESELEEVYHDNHCFPLNLEKIAERIFYQCSEYYVYSYPRYLEEDK